MADPGTGSISRGGTRSRVIGASRSGVSGRSLGLGPRAGVRYSGRFHHDHRHHHYFGYLYHGHHGHYVGYWDPFYYRRRSYYWYGGLPAFGFGVAYYDSYYDPYFPSTTVIVEQQPIYIVEEPAPVEPYPEVVPAEPPVVPAPAEEPLPPEEAPGQADFDAGVEAFFAGDYEAAFEGFSRAAEADAENGEAWLAMAHAAFALGRYDASAVGIAEAAALGGFPRGYRFDPSPMYQPEGTFQDLLAKLDDHRKKRPADADAHLVAAYLYVALGKGGPANEAIVTVLQLRPEDPTAPLLAIAQLPPLPPPDADEFETPDEGAPQGR
ncbi:MAG: tetratricopeptide repeat protein [Planctomycetota bacterium]